MASSSTTPHSSPLTPRPNKQARAKIAKETIHNLIPHILKWNDRARKGNNATELIYYSPLFSFFPPTPKPSTSSPDQSSSSIVAAPLNTAGTSTVAPISTSVAPAALKRIPKVMVIQSDTFDAAHTIIKALPNGSNARVGVLNMASFLRPGGGVLNGAMAQEESLCVRSTLYTALKEGFYRLPRLAGLYTPDVLVFRDSDGKDLPRAEWYFLDVISIAALKVPDVIVGPDGKEIYEHEKDKEEMILKIRLILQIALQKCITHLVLGALGCGAYHNPPEEVAKMFKKVILGDRKRGGVQGGIEGIVFAIFDDGENLRVFRDAFEGEGGGGDGKVDDEMAKGDIG